MPKPRSLVGKLLDKVSKKKNSPVVPDQEKPSPSTTSPAQALEILATQARAQQAQLDKMLAAIAELPDTPLKATLLKACAQVGTQLAGVDALRDVPSRSSRLQMVSEALGKLQVSLDKAAVIEPQAKVKPKAEGPGGDAPAVTAETFKARLTELIPRIKVVMTGGGEPAKAVQTLNAQATDLAKQKKFAEGMAVLDDLAKLLDERAAAPTPSTEGPKTKEEAEREDREAAAERKALGEALSRLRALQGAMGRLRVQVQSDLGNVPSALQAQFTAIDKLLALGKGAEKDQIIAAIDEAETLGQAIEADALKLLTERNTYMASWARMDSRVKVLRNHPVASHAAVKPRVDEAALALTTARTLAQDHRFAEATTAIKDVPSVCDAAELLADQIMRYLALLTDAQTGVATLTDSPHAPAQLLVTAARDKLAQAQTLANTGDYNGAATLLAALPQECIDADWICTKAREYVTLLAEKTDEVDNAKTWTSVYEVGPYMPAVETLLTSADYATTNDYAESVNLLTRVHYKLDELWGIIGQFKACREARKASQDQIDLVENHAGAPELTASINRLKSDQAHAYTQQQARQYVTATKLYGEVLKRAEEALLKAPEAEAYALRRTEVSNARTPLNVPEQVAAAELLADCDRLVRAAATQALALAFNDATFDLGVALERCASAKFIINNQALAGQWSTGAQPLIQSIDTDFDAAYNYFKQVHDIVSQACTDKVFKAPLKAALSQADQARSACDGGDVPGARQLLQDAHTACADILRQRDQRSVYEIMLTSNTDRYKKLQKADKTKALATPLATIEGKLNDAKNAASTGDYATAHARLGEANALVIQGEVDRGYAEAFINLRKGNITQWLGVLDTPLGLEAFPTEVPALKLDVQAAELLKTNNDFKGAYEALVALNERAALLHSQLQPYVGAKDKRQRWIIDKLDAIKNEPALAGDYLEILRQKAVLDQMFTDHRYEHADKMCQTVGVAVLYAEQTLQRHKAYLDEHKKAKAALDNLKLKPCLPLKDEIDALDALFKQAEDQVAARVHELAMTDLAQIQQRCATALPVRDAQIAYASALKLAQDARDALAKDYPANESVQLQLQDIAVRMTQADALATAKQYAQAQALADGVALSCAQARQLAKNQSEVADLATALQGPGGGSKDDLAPDLERVRALIDSLTLRKLGTVIEDLLTRARKELAQAEAALTTSDGAQARAQLAAAAATCARALSQAEQYTLMDEGLRNAHVQVSSAQQRHTEPPFVVASLEGLIQQLALARADAETGIFSAAQNALHLVNGELVTLLALAEQHVRYTQLKITLTRRLDELSRSNARHTVAAELKAIHESVMQGEAEAGKRAYPAAIKALEDATDQCDVATLQADMHCNKEPTEDDIKGILSKTDGEAQLDKIIASLPKSAKRKVVKLAFEQRFGSTLELFCDKEGTIIDSDKDAKAPDILRFYETMKALPKSHTKGNPCLAKIKRQGEVVATSSYNAGTRELKLSVGRGTDKTEEVIGQEWQLGAVDPDSKPADDEPPSTFEWTTLHEIGHAEDDKLSYMKKHGSQEDHGGWIEYGSNVEPIALAAAEHFGGKPAVPSLVRYLADYLLNYHYTPDPNASGDDNAEAEAKAKAKISQPNAPTGTDPVEWDRKLVAARAWCDSIREDKNLYYSASACSKAEIGGRIYQEAYANQWVSYSAAARRKGITGYQFRSPAEWFAELYAAYHTKKLQPTHPACKWLKTL